MNRAILVFLMLFCARVTCSDLRPTQVIHETVQKLKSELRWQGQSEQQSEMLWLQNEINGGSILLAVMQNYLPHIKIPKTTNQRTDAWRAFTTHWPICFSDTTPQVIQDHARFLSHIIFDMGEMRTVGIMTTITVAYLFHTALFHQHAADNPRMTPIIELADGELRQGMQLYTLYHHHLWLNDDEDLESRLPNLKRLAEWHLWWGLSMLESYQRAEAPIYFFRSLLGDGVRGMSEWISSRNDVEASYTTNQVDLLYMENQYLTLPPFGGATTSYRTYVLLPFQRLCRYPLLLQSIKQLSEQQHGEHVHALTMLQKQLDGAISQINLDRKSADLKEEVIGDWDAASQGSLLLYVPDIQIRFGIQHASQAYAVALYQHNLIILEKRGNDLLVRRRVPRYAIYDFSHESQGEVLVCWFDDDDQLYAHFSFPTEEVGNQFMRQLATS